MDVGDIPLGHYIGPPLETESDESSEGDEGAIFMMTVVAIPGRLTTAAV